jgi:L-aspartate oxidase
MISYDERGSLAPRDITARAIDAEIKKKGGEFVLLDVRDTDLNKFKTNFPNITEKCFSVGVDIEKQMIPVVPAAHYMCGGIKVDQNSQTSINRLYACGECSSTGLHGANRLASNSLLEALVFANRAFISSINEMKNEHNLSVPEWNMEGTKNPKEWLIIDQATKELQHIMSNYVGIVRSNYRLKKAKDRVDLLFKEMSLEFKDNVPSKSVLELRNMINVAHLIIEQALIRKENKGLHYNIDNL